MNHKSMLRAWQEYLRRCLEGVHLYQVQALAAFSQAVMCARHCHLSRVSASVPSAAQFHSTRRRLLRFLDNDRIDVEALCEQLGAWLKRWNCPKTRLLLLLDETPLRNDMRVLKISVAYRRRALPLLWCVYPLSHRAQPMPTTLETLLERAAHMVALHAPQAQVILLADRGLCWPQLIRWCHHHHWHYVLRAQGNTRIRLTPHSSPQPLQTLVSQPGQWFCGQAEVFQKAGYIECNVMVCWPTRAQERWILVTSLPATLHVGRWYARRMWQEQSFRDEKSHGFCWHESHVHSPERMNRLLLLLALAQLRLMRLGEEALSTQWTQLLGLSCRSTRRLWSCFRTGWHLLQYALVNSRPIPCDLNFTPP